MKTIATACLLLVCATARADASLDHQSYCYAYGTMFQTIAAWRDQGSRPENTLGLIAGLKGITVQEKKEAITAVYTDKAFATSRGPAFGLQMRQRCLQQAK